MYEIYFSPTGGTKKVTEIIGGAWACEAERVDLMNPALQPEQYVFSADDICIVAVPSFGGRVPVTAVERLKRWRATERERFWWPFMETGNSKIR